MAQLTLGPCFIKRDNHNNSMKSHCRLSEYLNLQRNHLVINKIEISFPRLGKETGIRLNNAYYYNLKEDSHPLAYESSR